ncbi:MAG: [FeFe] hydrogenase H-cluster radical SAM maturase HydE [Candidatus Gastranaerophilales bacterium]|nr:[FeFe] hydrogenase H-cluster radical SAM maturase HydE [Candidatus Gastranaerophilales bacterium]
MNELLQKLEKEHILSKKELIILLEDNEINSELFDLANKTREKHVGSKVHLRGLLEFSNVCSNNCKYCGLRIDNKNIERYNLTFDDILYSANIAKEAGYKTLVLQSGENQAYPRKQMKEIISKLKKMDFAITLSLGEKTFEEYKNYKEAGADRYLLRIETTDKELYKKMHPNMSFENRVRCLKDLKELDYEVGSGFLIGLPEQTISSYADDLLFLKQIEVDMAGIGPFIPNPDTPLANENEGNFLLALKIMSIMRLLLPDINIPATTAMEVLKPDGQIIALQSGANVIMPNITKPVYREKYSLYPGKNSNDNIAKENSETIKIKLQNINRGISEDFGISNAYLIKKSTF